MSKLKVLLLSMSLVATSVSLSLAAELSYSELVTKVKTLEDRVQHLTLMDSYRDMKLRTLQATVDEHEEGLKRLLIRYYDLTREERYKVKPSGEQQRDHRIPPR